MPRVKALHDADNRVADCQFADVSANVMSDELIRRTIPRYKWFAHVSFGRGLVARSTEWPDAPDDCRGMGLSKFEFIVRRHLPDLQGARVLDLGCNAGVIAIQMARMGAAEVIGIDNSRSWPGWREQAEFVRAALEWRCRAKYNVRYIDLDMRDLPSIELGHFDVVTALNSLYYLTVEDIARVVRYLSGVTDRLIVQCNIRDNRHLGSRPMPGFMKETLQRNGFSSVHVDAPWDRPSHFFLPRRYSRPVVIGCVRENHP